MSDSRDLLLERVSRVRIHLSEVETDSVLAYFELLRKWDSKLNLTGHDVKTPSAEAVDRLLIEPIVAARITLRADRVLDVGSGGGSPAIPFCLTLGTRPRLVMVESRSKKSTFLREALLHVGLQGSVETARFEQVAGKHGGLGGFDVITVRAVRRDEELMARAAELLATGGRLLLFHGSDLPAALPDDLRWDRPRPLVPEMESQLSIGVKLA